jgi:flagellar L-ring protein precursor FlgH
MRPLPLAALGLLAALAACSETPIGRPPEMTTIGQRGPDTRPILSPERAAIAVPQPQAARYAYQQASLWNAGPETLLGDRRAKNLGDLLTIVIEIDEQAEIRNSTDRSRTGSEGASVGGFFGLGNVLGGTTDKLSPDVELGSDSRFRGNGSVRRSEKLALRVAATVVEVLPNGQLVVQGDQEVRVSNELRDLQVTGIVRPMDISRYNEIPYDRIAGARISYGGRGQITDAQQPRYGQQIADRLMPF